MLDFGLSQTLAVRLAKVPEALPMRHLIYVSNDAFDAILEPKYTNQFTFSTFLPSILIDDGVYVPWLRNLVFLRLIIRSKFEHANEKRLRNELLDCY